MRRTRSMLSLVYGAQRHHHGWALWQCISFWRYRVSLLRVSGNPKLKVTSKHTIRSPILAFHDSMDTFVRFELLP